jgi:vacuolar protein sorting-associated protein 13A/C
MVFEAVVSNQLNKFLGAYIENVNSSQLKLGLLGGEFCSNLYVLTQICFLLDLMLKIILMK